MILSDPFCFAFRGKPALLRVVRNNGHCWGELRCGEERYAVNAPRDLYDLSDEEAVEALKRASRTPKNLAPSLLT